MKTQLIAYLNFNGKCREALTFYHTCLGGDITLQKVSESPMAAQMPSEEGAKILHGIVTNNGITLMGSDMIGSNLVMGNSVTLCLNCATDDEINSYYTKLSSGGNVKMPLHQSFWGATYGELIDKFGLLWILNYARS